jgi:hypothetical protein
MSPTTQVSAPRFESSSSARTLSAISSGFYAQRAEGRERARKRAREGAERGSEGGRERASRAGGERSSRAGEGWCVCELEWDGTGQGHEREGAQGEGACARVRTVASWFLR